MRPTDILKEQCGTPAYIAPEILKNRGYSGFTVDMWSVGVVLFAMLYGSVPFKANNMNELHQLIIKAKYTLKEDISSDARSLLKGLLERDPSQRLTTAQVLKHPWMQNIDMNCKYLNLIATLENIFNEQEKAQIRCEFTFNA